jgi:hypothetical protein
MNQLPVVTICRTDGGFRVLCTCTWRSFRITRLAADLLATEHRKSHGKGR